jgi:hypothetical protein
MWMILTFGLFQLLIGHGHRRLAPKSTVPFKIWRIPPPLPID